MTVDTPLPGGTTGCGALPAPSAAGVELESTATSSRSAASDSRASSTKRWREASNLVDGLPDGPRPLTSSEEERSLESSSTESMAAAGRLPLVSKNTGMGGASAHGHSTQRDPIKRLRKKRLR